MTQKITTITTRYTKAKWNAMTADEQADAIEHEVLYAPDSRYKQKEMKRARKLRENKK